MKYFSIFSGIGGFDLVLNRQGYKCIGYSEIDKYCIQTYEKNFGNGVINYGDATKINPNELPDFDLLCGGFPCQAFSIAGKRKGFEYTGGTLFFEIARILKIKKPTYFILENVKGLLNHDKGKTFATIIQTLDELGYDFEWMVLNSKFFGVPQNRERVFIIGHLRGEPRPEILPICECIGETKELVYVQKSDREIARVYSPEGLSPTLHGKTGGWQEPKIGLYAIPVLTPNRENKRQNGRRFKEDGDPSFTLTGQDIHGVYDGFIIRRLTPIECLRLQGFPDNWFPENISDTQRYKQCGNTVTVNVVEAIIKRFT